MKKQEELDEEVRQIYVHLQHLGLANFFKSDQFDLFCEENKLEKVRDDIFKSLLGTQKHPLPIKYSPDLGEVIDYGRFPEIIVKPFLKKFLIEILDKKESEFVEIIVSLLTYYSRYNINLADHKPTRIDNDLMCRIGLDLLDLDFDERDIRMYYSLEGYDLDALLSMNDPKPIPKGGRKKYQKNNQEVGVISDKPNRKIFIVHGHDSTLKQEVELYLRSLSLEPIILHQQVSRNKTIIEKVEFYSDVGFAVILLTPDDIGAEAGIGCHDIYFTYFRAIDSDYLEEVSGLFSEILTKNEINVKDNTQTFVEIRDLYKELKMRARQNVLFECGYFIGKLGRENVAILCDQIIEIPTDLNGLCYLKIDKWSQWRNDLAMEIDAAGIKIDKIFLKYDIYNRAKTYLLNDGFKLLKITSRTGEKEVIKILYSNLKSLSPDFIVDMKSMGFIDLNNEITEIGNRFIHSAIWEYSLIDHSTE